MQIFSIRQISSLKIRWRIVFYYLRDMERRFTTYAQYLRRATGLERVQKISVDAGFTCPNRDGAISTRGCAFCRNDAFTPRYCSGTRDILRQIDEGIAFHARRGRTADGYIAYLQSYSNTYAPVDELARIYARALSHPSVAGLIIGTRPDTVDDEKLDMIADLARHRYVAIEYGIESTCDATLDALGRGHDFAASRRAVEAAASRGIAVGGHFILGLPGEDSASILHGTADIARMPLSSIKLHRLQILRSTPLRAAALRLVDGGAIYRSRGRHNTPPARKHRHRAHHKRGAAALPRQPLLARSAQRYAVGDARQTHATARRTSGRHARLKAAGCE